MSSELTAEQQAFVNGSISAGLHALLLEHPEYLNIGVAPVADIFRAGVICGVRTMIEMQP